MTTPTVTRPSFSIRARFTHRPEEVEFDAPCPHGRLSRWVARRFDTGTTTLCLCTCREGGS